MLFKKMRFAYNSILSYLVSLVKRTPYIFLQGVKWRGRSAKEKKGYIQTDLKDRGVLASLI